MSLAKSQIFNRAPNFVTVHRLCNIQNTSNSQAKTFLRRHLFTEQLPDTAFKCQLFFGKGKTETIFHTSSVLDTIEIL